MSRICLLSTVVFLLNCICGCGDAAPENSSGNDTNAVVAEAPEESTSAEPDTSSASTAGAAAETTTEEPTKTPPAAVGSLRGVITFKGEVPAPRVIQATKDPEFCSAGEGEAQDVNVKDGKLSGAVVELTLKGKDLPAFVAPENGFVIRQKDCRFMPRLLVAYDGAELVVHNGDKVEHNVNAGGWNLIQSPGAPEIKQPMRYGGNPFTRVTCNIHNWMESWVYIARSPFYAASDDSGEFLIEGIPVGTKIRGTVTHASLGKKRFTANIEAGATAEMNFEFEAK